MKTAIIVTSLLMTTGLLMADPAAAEDPTKWCDVDVRDPASSGCDSGPTGPGVLGCRVIIGSPTPAGVVCGPPGPLCGGVVIGGQAYCKP